MATFRHRFRNTNLSLRLALLVALTCVPAMAARHDVANLFQLARYDEARQSLEMGGEGFRPGEATLWQVRLATDPEDALVMLREALSDDRLPGEVRIRMARETADIEFGMGRYQSSYKALTPLLQDDQGTLPGDVYLRAGLALRALGDLQKAREMLASVKPGDPAFLLARYYLGDIALELNDAALALRYFESALDDGASNQSGRIAGGRWRAFLAEGRDQDARELENDLSSNHPGSLAMLEIQRLRREQEEELAAKSLVEVPDTQVVDADGEGSRGRYALQLGAFSDRGLALDFMRRFRSQLPDLRIDEVRDARGQFLYKVRTGSFVNPVLARTEAHRLADQLDMEVIVADLSDSQNRID